MTVERDKKRNPQAILWVSNNRSKLTQIAEECACTPQFVGYVLYGKRRSRDGKVERLLKEAGAPAK